MTYALCCAGSIASGASKRAGVLAVQVMQCTAPFKRQFSMQLVVIQYGGRGSLEQAMACRLHIAGQDSHGCSDMPTLMKSWCLHDSDQHYALVLQGQMYAANRL